MKKSTASVVATACSGQYFSVRESKRAAALDDYGVDMSFETITR